ncbi:NAD-dependent epimerase/dehydratase family protein [Flavivirga sp. 57AJ16]|uniref:NAD-dependent epimerase/dehydratase family protein n=1 Tax=Flavivirga sp. 57AJ16 TaxID=3025307 RepID=UPI0023658251|nr:NAD-dependent epimerase/dehydratase family protein [Flavivirga sp. 57AJ16]MDD7886232.1 NAD-dependent epimerase/dehydratase family protein [Flavivirga sp. 57AJ16]
MDIQKTILVTGAAGFIGYHLCEKLLKLGHRVIGLDNINDYYDVNLKYARLNELGIQKEDIKAYGFFSVSRTYKKHMQFVKMDIEDEQKLVDLFTNNKFDVVCNLAAQAGVRYSIKNPQAYINSNIVGFFNILECCRNFNVKKLVYASSSSVYGNSSKEILSEESHVDLPISLYAATKKSNELMAHAYSYLYGLETIGLRFFTVYGPWGRPDMALFLFTEAILNKKPIKVFNNGNLLRDFTYIDNIVNGIISTLVKPANSKYSIYNVGNGSPVKLEDFIKAIETEVGIKAIKSMLPMQPGDVSKTWSNTTKFRSNYNNCSSTPIEQGIKKFVDWYKKFYDVE